MILSFKLVCSPEDWQERTEIEFIQLYKSKYLWKVNFTVSNEKF